MIKSVDVVDCMKYLHLMVSAPHASHPHFFFLGGGGGRVGLEILDLFKNGGAEKICYFGWDSKFKERAVTLKDTIHLENISFSL